MKTWTQQKMLTATAAEVRAHRDAIRDGDPDRVEGEGEFLEVALGDTSEMLKESYLAWVEMTLISKEANEKVNTFYEGLNKPKFTQGLEPHQDGKVVPPKSDA